MQQENKLELNELAIDSLRTSAKWSTFLSIIGFIGLGFILLPALLVGSVFSTMSDNMGMAMNPMAGIMKFMPLFYVFLAAIYFFPVYYLFKYAAGMKKALNFRNSEMVAESLLYLKSHHKFLGIMTIVVISLYIVGMIAMVIFAASMSARMM